MMCDSSGAWNAQVRVVSRDGGQNLGPVEPGHVGHFFRVDDDIPMNEGCLKPITIILPDDCLLQAQYPAAVIAGNVETSQIVTDTLYGALGVMAAAQEQIIARHFT